jgi:hypothetical protein
MLKSDPKSAAVDMAKALRDVFKKYSYQSRIVAWGALSRGNGEKSLEQLLLHPAEAQISDFSKLSFRDWIKSSQSKKKNKK